MPNAETRSPTLNSESSGAHSTTPAASMPGMKGGGSLSWYSPLLISRSGKQTPAARILMARTWSLPTTSGTSVYSRPSGPERSCTTQAFMWLRSADREVGRLRRGQVVDFTPVRSDVVDRRRGLEGDALVLEQRGALHLAATDDEDRATVRHLFGDQVGHHRRHEIRRQVLQHLGRQDVLGHAGRRDRRQRVGLDVVLGAFLGQRVDHSDEPELRGAVVRLAEIAEQPTGRGGDQHATVALLTKVRPCGADDVVATVEVHLEDGIPVLERHLVEGAVAQDAGVADDAVDLAELVDRGLDDVLGALGLGDAVVVGDRSAPGVLDLLDDIVGHVVSGAGAVAGTAEVVDHDAGAFFGEGQRVLAPQTTTGSGDDDNAILHSGHELPISRSSLTNK